MNFLLECQAKSISLAKKEILRLTWQGRSIINDDMKDETEYRTPGQLIKALLKSRGWTQRVLSVVLGINETTINNIVADRRQFDAETAIALGEVFNESPERFLSLQQSYRLAMAQLHAVPDPNRNMRAHLFGNLPIAEMMKRGWIAATDIRKVEQVEESLVRFFNAQSSDEIEILPHAAKKTNVNGEITDAQLAWLYRVRQIASEMMVAPYTQSKARIAVAKLRKLVNAAEEVRKVPRILTECGIRLVIVETLKGAKIDGVCFWLDKSSPVIGLTLRYDRIDNFWFVLRHELEHVLNCHGQDAVILDAELEGERAGTGDSIPDEERIANQEAANFCVPEKKIESFIARKAPFFAERDILGFSRTLQVHPGIVAGQLQHRTGRYDRFRNHQVKIRSIIAPSAVVDGWGDVYPVEE